MNKDIDKAAREYAEDLVMRVGPPKPFNGHDIKDAFIAGAHSRQSEIDELVEALEEAMKWISVDEGSPEVGATVLIKVGDSNKFVSTAHFAHERFIIDFYDMRDDEPTHWRPIDTPKASQLLEKYGKK